jgi:flagellar hook assembly protein FlgD
VSRDDFIFHLPQPEAKPSVTEIVAVVPNPFNPTTTIQYALASQGKVEINIYDVAGRLVEELANGTEVAGPHSAVWNGTDRRGSPVASGVYFVRMVTNGQLFTKKMVLLK